MELSPRDGDRGHRGPPDQAVRRGVRKRDHLKLRAACLSGLLALWTVSAAAQQLPFFVVVHPDNATDMMSLEMLAEIYRGERTAWESGRTIQAVDLDPGSSVRRRFSEAILGRSTEEVVAQRTGNGTERRRPSIAADEREAIDIVRENRSAIAYVSTSAPLDGVKLVVLYRPPEAVERVPPEYPQAALRAGAEGDVVLRVLIAEDGTVADVSVVQDPRFGLAQAAVRAVKQWRFTPATSGGIPISVEIEVAVNFEL